MAGLRTGPIYIKANEGNMIDYKMRAKIPRYKSDSEDYADKNRDEYCDCVSEADGPRYDCHICEGTGCKEEKAR